MNHHDEYGVGRWYLRNPVDDADAEADKSGEWVLHADYRRVVATLRDELEGTKKVRDLAFEKIATLRALLTKINVEVSQTLGRALGYPRFCDDQKNFPGSTDADGVCVGDEVAETLAEQAAAKIADHESALAAAVQAEREAILSALQQMRDAEGNEPDGRGYGLGLAQAAVKARSSPAPAVGEWRLERSGLWRFVVGERCLASISTNINRWYTFSPEGGAGESGYVGDLESSKRDAIDALVRQGWYSRPSPAVDVLKVVRAYVEAESAVRERPISDEDWEKNYDRKQAAFDDLCALVAPRTAEAAPAKPEAREGRS